MKADVTLLDVGDHDSEKSRLIERHNRKIEFWAYFGLTLVGIGFLLQLAGVLFKTIWDIPPKENKNANRDAAYAITLPRTKLKPLLFMGILRQQKEVALKLVGQWYSKDEKLGLIFDFSDNIKDKFPLQIIKDGRIIKSKYDIHVYPRNIEAYKNFQFYVQLGFLEIKNYFIKNLTDDELILHEMINGYDLAEEEIK